MVLELPGGLFGQQDVRETPTTAFTAAEAVPIGCILPYLKNFTSVPAMPTGFLECDGSVINDADSPMNGETLPDLNGNEFLRGAATSGGTGGGTTGSGSNHSHGSGTLATDSQSGARANAAGGTATTVAHAHDVDSGSTANEGSHTHASQPKYYNVVWIIRIK